MPNDAEVPLDWMPPGTSSSPVPSDEIFPPQSLTLRFNHKKHVKDLKQTCKVCHAAAYSSDVASDRLLPKPADTCDGCHDVDHSNLSAVKAGTDANGQCNFCHLGENCHGKIDQLELATRDNLPRMAGCFSCHNMSGAAA